MKSRNLSLRLKSIIFALVFFICGSSIQAQNRGTFNGYTAPSFDVASTAAVDSINPFNGNLNVSIPFVGVGGRGNAGYTIGRTSNIKWGMYHQWLDGHAQHFIHHPTTHALDGKSSHSGDISYSPGIIEVRRTFTGNPNCYPDGTSSSYGEHWRIVFSRPDGSVMEFVSQQGQAEAYGLCPNGPLIPNTNFGTVFNSFDGSFTTIVLDAPAFRYSTHQINGYLMFPDGTKYRVENNRIVWMRDRDGNTTTLTWALVEGQGYKIVATKDSIGREVTFEYKVNNNDQYGLHDRITFKGINGETRVFRVSFKPMGEILRADQTLQTKGALFAFWDHWGGANEILNLERISAMWLPDGKAFKFFYNSYGEVARIGLPDGGAYEYDWGASLSGGDPRGLIQVQMYEPINNFSSLPDINRRVLEKRIYPNGESGTFFTTRITYSQTEGQGSSTTHNTIRTFDALGNLRSQQKHYFNGTPILQTERHPFHLPSTLEGLEFKTEVFDVINNSPVLKQRVEKTWQAFGLGNPRNIEKVTTLLDTNQITKTTSISPIDGSIGFDQFNNSTDVWEYDFGSGQPGPLLRRTHIDYVTDENYTSFSGAHLRNLPLQIAISSDTAGANKVSLTQYEYDNYTADANHAPLVSRSNVIGHDSVNYNTYFQRRGNITSITRYANAPAQSEAIAVYSQYDILGNVIKTIDANGNASTTNYDDNFGVPDGESTTNTPPAQLNGSGTFAFATSTTNPRGWISRVQYDYFTGFPVNAQDINGVISKTVYNNISGRPTQTVSAIGTSLETQTSIFYDDANRRVETKSDLFQLNDNLARSENFYDGLGRLKETRQYEASGNYRIILTQYDALGKPYKQSNTFRPTEISSGNPILWTQSYFDSFGRVTKVKTPDNAEVLTTYEGNRTLITDQSGKQRRSITNALGQLVRLDEPNSSNQLGDVSNPNQATYYYYNTLGNMTHVQQGNQYRYFLFDSLGRMLRVRQPEQEINNNLGTAGGADNNSWTTGFTYDNNGNVLTSTDAKGTTITNIYDTLNRVTQRNYNDNPQTPAVTYSYDEQDVTYSKGKLTKVASSVSETRYSAYDLLGRLLSTEQRTPLNGETIITAPPRTSTYIYNLSGSLTQEIYPSGRVVKHEYDGGGEIAKITSQKSGGSFHITYASNFSYTASGAVLSMRLGNGKWENTKFNSRLQPTEIGLGSSATDAGLWKVVYEYGEPQANGSINATKNAGDIARQTLTIPETSFVTAYQYDSLDRLTEARETTNGSQNWVQNFSYDRYGNRTNFSETIGSTISSGTPSIDVSSNRFNAGQNFGYDKNGNITQDTDPTNNYTRSFTFNGDNKLIQVKDVSAGNQVKGTYSFDGEGKRVKKVTDSEVTIFVYSLGRLVAEYSTQFASQPAISYSTADHLRSPRVITDQLGTVKARRDFMPFGQDIYAGIGGRTGDNGQKYSASGDSMRQKFTGYLKDSETSLDFAEARMYDNRYAKFTAVDPLLASGLSSNPQTFNRYVYTTNRPLVFVDPTGLIMDDYFININGDIRVKRNSDDTDRYFIFDDNKGFYTLEYTLDRNSAGLVLFPDSGYGFTRYSANDTGGRDPATGENVGTGDRYLKPDVAAALFGLASQLKNEFGITIAFGDMSSSNGSDPWSPGGTHHVGHGHNGNRVGVDIDFRYIGENGESRQGNFEIVSSGNPDRNNYYVSASGFSIKKNQSVFDLAAKFGFTRNFHDVVEKEAGRLTAPTSSNFRNASQYDGHRDHGHLGFEAGSITITRIN